MDTVNSVHFSSKSSEWETPKTLFDFLDAEFHFQLDAAATRENALCKNYFTLADKTLLQNWAEFKSVWCNPPYGRESAAFIRKGAAESKKGCMVVMLLPARTDTKVFHETVLMAKEIRFIAGRLRFVNRLLPSYRSDGNFVTSPAPFPSMVVVFDGFFNRAQPIISTLRCP